MVLLGYGLKNCPDTVDQRKNILRLKLFPTFLLNQHCKSEFVLQFVYQLHNFVVAVPETASSDCGVLTERLAKFLTEVKSVYQ